ncbi:MAG: CPBP family intramembrane metalloprotease [Planctomycetaceae bacterium]|jgi:membrane protease YdiL (CAAX protease family)|nr:CPBP family intramembrane metalloprotease [Planctomycetaceae bacterium]
MHPTEKPTTRYSESAVICVALLLPTLVTWLYFVALTTAPAVIQQTAYAVGKTVQFALPAVWIYWLCRERFEWLRPTRTGLAANVLFGGAVVALMMVIYHLWLNPTGYLAPGSPAGQAVVEKVRGFGVGDVWRYVALGAFYSIIHSGLEEYYWRWFVFGRLKRSISLGSAIALSSVGFMLHHVILLGIYFDWAPLPVGIFSAAVAVGGAVWAWLYNRSGSLFGPWIGHLLIDAGIFLMGYDLVRGALL